MSGKMSYCLIAILWGIVSLCFPRASAGEPWAVFEPHGSFVLDKTVRAAVTYYNDEWRASVQDKETVRIESGQGMALKGAFVLLGGQAFSFEQNASTISDTEITYAASVSSPDGVQTRQLCLSLALPVGKFAGKSVRFDETPVVLPAELGETILRGAAPVTRIVIPLESGRLVVEGAVKAMVQDNRAFKGDTYALRINFAPSSGLIRESALKLTLRLEQVDATPISLAPVANMSFKDEQEGDGKGGWTDQGPANDLRMFQPGERRFLGLPFSVVDPAKNGGKGCLVLTGAGRADLPAEAAIGGNGGTYKYLYFLHAAAWTKGNGAYGAVAVEHTDGSESVFEIKGFRDVADWWSPNPLENGAVVWTGENQSSYVGLYLSRFPIQEKPIKRIRLAATDKPLWMIAGITGSNEEIALPSYMGEYYVVENKEWRPFTHSLDVVPGSALDLSHLVDGPAGKYGRVVASADGHFRFAQKPDVNVRFYGTNLCLSANYLSKEECERLADRLAAYGYNSVRFHHHDGQMVDKNAPDSLTFDREQLDKLDYLFHCLKRKGIYITTDIFVSRYLKPAEVKELRENPELRGRDIKQLVPFSDEVQDNLKAFAKNWLEHVNPYTGIAWKDDPALFSISLVNENALHEIWDKEPFYQKLYEEKAAAWAGEQGLPNVTAEDRASALTQFVTAMQIKSYEDLKAYVADELGCNVLYSDSNMRSFVCQTLARDLYDYVDNHGYWDHPKFPQKKWNLPYAHGNLSVLRRWCGLPAGLMPTRIMNKPFLFTEFNYVFPNQYRSEGNPVIGALAALQDWDGMYRFAFAHDDKSATTVTAARSFNVSSDPLTLLGERIVSLLFLRGDVRVAKASAVCAVMPDAAKTLATASGSGKGFPKMFERLGLIHRIGSVVLRDGVTLPGDTRYVVAVEEADTAQIGGKKVYAGDDRLLETLAKDGQLSAAQYDPQAETTRSDTGEIALDVKENTFRVVTPRSECLVMPGGKDLAGDVLRVTGNTTYATVFAGSLDGDKPLAQSGRVLVLHLTDIKNTKTKFLDPDGRMLAQNGELPHLVRKGTARIALKREAAGTPEVWALDVTGKRLGKVAASVENGTLTFIADTEGDFGAVMAYEISMP